MHGPPVMLCTEHRRSLMSPTRSRSWLYMYIYPLFTSIPLQPPRCVLPRTYCSRLLLHRYIQIRTYSTVSCDSFKMFSSKITQCDATLLSIASRPNPHSHPYAPAFGHWPRDAGGLSRSPSPSPAPTPRSYDIITPPSGSALAVTTKPTSASASAPARDKYAPAVIPPRPKPSEGHNAFIEYVILNPADNDVVRAVVHVVTGLSSSEMSQGLIETISNRIRQRRESSKGKMGIKDVEKVINNETRGVRSVSAGWARAPSIEGPSLGVGVGVEV